MRVGTVVPFCPFFGLRVPTVVVYKGAPRDEGSDPSPKINENLEPWHAQGAKPRTLARKRRKTSNPSAQKAQNLEP